MSKKVVILGAGFGGIYALKKLIKKLNLNEVDLTIIDKTNYFLFTPLLHEVATGGLSQQNVVESIRSIIKSKRVKFIKSEIIAVDIDKKNIKIGSGSLDYDYLIIALGSKTNYYDIKGAEENSYELKNLQDSILLRNRFIDVFEEATKINSSEKRKELLTFSIIGGGPTGVELAAEMAEFFYETFSKIYSDINFESEVTINIISSGEKLLSGFHKKIQDSVKSILEKKGINIILNSRVKEVTESTIILESGDSISSKTNVWVAGVKANIPDCSGEIKLDQNSRIVVDSNLRLIGNDDVYAIGDIASFTNSRGHTLEMLAQVATVQGEYVGVDICKRIKGKSNRDFDYSLKGMLLSLGQWNAFGQFGQITLSGKFMWWVWRTVYLTKFTSLSKQIKIVIDWTVNIFYPRDTAKS